MFFALYRVLTGGGGTQYLPDGGLRTSIMEGGERFLGMNLACSPGVAGGGDVQVAQQVGELISCGTGAGARIPYFIMVALMVGTTFYQQKQMQRASSGPQAQQMKIMTTIMPVFLGFISFQIAAGVLVYWVTTNTWQIVQQSVMLRRREEAATVKDGKGNGSQAAAKKPVQKPGGTGSGNAGSRKKRRKR